MARCPACGRVPLTGRMIFDALHAAGLEPEPYMHAAEDRVSDSGDMLPGRGYGVVTLDSSFDLEAVAVMLNGGV